MAKKVTVFCGSYSGQGQTYENLARTLAKEIANLGLELVYGGGHVGLMGILADAALAAGVRVTGVIPRHLYDREIAHRNLTELIVVESMHERKFKMAERGDIYVAMPGGFGTLEELFEMITWAQIGLHTKPCALLNAEGFYDGLIQWMDHATVYGFIDQPHRDMLIISSKPAELLEKALEYQHRVEPKWNSRAAVET
jgi:uncharacterized protein (TIGR00730 family)